MTAEELIELANEYGWPSDFKTDAELSRYKIRRGRPFFSSEDCQLIHDLAEHLAKTMNERDAALKRLAELDDRPDD
jgi:hypothetical protein